MLLQHLKHHLAEADGSVLFWSSVCWGHEVFGWSDKKGGTRKTGCKLFSDSLAWLMLDSKEAYLERVVAKIFVTV